MKPDRTTPRVIALFKEHWPGGFLPVKMIVNELGREGPRVSQRTVESSLAKSVNLGQLRVVKSDIDGGAVYSLTSYAESHPALVKSLQQTPLRTLQRQNAEFDSKAVRRWIRSDGLKGAHDLRPEHKCVPCGNVPHRNPEFPDMAERKRREATGMKLSGSRSPMP
jgi:hypothetical protein